MSCSVIFIKYTKHIIAPLCHVPSRSNIYTKHYPNELAKERKRKARDSCQVKCIKNEDGNASVFEQVIIERK